MKGLLDITFCNFLEIIDDQDGKINRWAKPQDFPGHACCPHQSLCLSLLLEYFVTMRDKDVVLFLIFGDEEPAEVLDQPEYLFKKKQTFSRPDVCASNCMRLRRRLFLFPYFILLRQ